MSVGFKIDTEISAHIIAKIIQKQKHLQTNLLTHHGMSSHLISPGATHLVVEILNEQRMFSPKYFSLPIKPSASS